MICPDCVYKLVKRANGSYDCDKCGVNYSQQELSIGAEPKPLLGKKQRTRSQIGKAARSKGMKAQNEFKKIVGGEVVPLSGQVGGDFSNDIHLWNTWQGEVKRFATGEKTLYSWLEDQREKPDFVAFRADNKPWVVSMHVDKFNRILDVQRAAAELLLYTEDGMPAPHAFAQFMAATEGLKLALQQSTRLAMQQAIEKMEKGVKGNE